MTGPATSPRSMAGIGWTIAAASFGFSIVQLDVTAVNVALPRIGADFGVGVASLQWVVDAYALVFAVLLLTAGFLGDRFGARRLYLAGLGIFALASLGCGCAANEVQLIAARALQGSGAAAMLPSSLALLNHAAGHDAGLRARAVGWWTAASSVNIAAGPIVGGLLLGITSWRSIFFINLPVCLLGAAMTLRVAETERHGRGRGLDPSGQILAILALTGLTGALIEAHPLGWSHGLVVGGIALAILAGAGFVMVEARGREPMLPLGLFRIPNFTPAIVYGIVVNLTYYGVVFVLSLYLQRVLLYGPTAAGLAYLPLTATFLLGNLASASIVARYGTRLAMIFGAIVDACGFALLLTLGVGSPYWQMVPAFALMPAGMGTGVPAMTTLVLGTVDKRFSGVAAAVLNAARQAGGAIGVAMFGALASEDAVVGLHASATIAVLLLLGAAVLAAFGIAKRPPGAG